MTTNRDEEVRRAVRDRYAGIAASSRDSCGCSPSPCCGPAADSATSDAADGKVDAALLGYAAEDLAQAPDGANLGLGCGNPVAIASLAAGETVLDLGSGGGLDCFLAAARVGADGKVIGVDMTPEMVARARANAARGAYANVEFRLGEIEHLPVADASVDVILSNCVINLSTDKDQVYREAFRVLKPGGRLAISDTVAIAPLPAALREDLELYSACAGGSLAVPDLEQRLAAAGFGAIEIAIKPNSGEFIGGWSRDVDLSRYIASALIQARKPSA